MKTIRQGIVLHNGYRQTGQIQVVIDEDQGLIYVGTTVHRGDDWVISPDRLISRSANDLEIILV